MATQTKATKAETKDKAADSFDYAKMAMAYPQHANSDTVLFCIWTLKSNPGARLPDIQAAWTGKDKIMGRAMNSAKKALGLVPPSSAGSKGKRTTADPELAKKIKAARTLFPQLAEVFPAIRKLEKLQKGMGEVREALLKVPEDARGLLFSLFPILKGFSGPKSEKESVPF